MEIFDIYQQHHHFFLSDTCTAPISYRLGLYLAHDFQDYFM